VSLGALSALGLLSCSLTRTDVTHCSTEAECREAFGLSGVCGEEGYCVVMAEQPRCEVEYPADYEQNPGDYEGILFVGVIIDGENRVHRGRSNAVQVALQDANEAGTLVGLEGRPFGLIECTNNRDFEGDSFDQQRASVEVARWLRDVPQVLFIVGPMSSGDNAAVYEELNDEEPRVLIISPSASSDRLTSLDGENPTDEDPGLLWRTAVPDGQQSPEIAEDIRARGISKLAIIHATGAYGESLAETVVAELDGSSVSVTREAYENEAQLTNQIVATGSSDAEEVLFISSSAEDIVSFINTAASRPGYATKTFFLTDAAANAALLDGVSDPAVRDRIRGTRPVVDLDSAELETFVARYQIRFGMANVLELSFTPNAFDAAWLGLYGTAWAYYENPDDPDLSARNIARGLRQVSSPDATKVSNTTPASWTTVQQEFEARAAIDVTGASGDLDYNPQTEELSGNFEVWVIRDGDLVTAPPEP
jgi:branched-chain amino acid transport system substrate-binding protein